MWPPLLRRVLGGVTDLLAGGGAGVTLPRRGVTLADVRDFDAYLATESVTAYVADAGRLCVVFDVCWPSTVAMYDIAPRQCDVRRHGDSYDRRSYVAGVLSVAT